jgi:hypothetical protein
MPIDITARLREIETKGPVQVRKPGFGKATLHDLFQPIPEGGNGKIKGRDAASVMFLGHLKSGGMDYEIALGLLHMWNERFCEPPLDSRALTEKASRLWVEFTDKQEETRREEELAEQAITFLDIPRMEEEAAKSAAQGWIMEGGIPAGGLVYITAPPAFGKTWVVLDLIRACLMGERWLGRYEMQRTPVMYLDEEMGVVRVLPRIKKLGIPRNADLLYANRAGVKLDNNRHREEIVREIVKHGIKIVVVDSLTRIHNLDEGSNRDMARLYSCMRDIMDAGATLVVCHHDRKGGQGDSNVGHDRARGAGDIMAAADMVYSVEKSENVHKLVCTKSRLVAEEDAISCSFVIEDSEDRNFTYVRAINHQEKSSRALDATEEAVVGFLRAAITANTSEIKNGVPMNAQKVQAALESLIRNGEVIFQAGQRGAKEYSLRSKESSGIF